MTTPFTLDEQDLLVALVRDRIRELERRVADQQQTIEFTRARGITCLCQDYRYDLAQLRALLAKLTA